MTGPLPHGSVRTLLSVNFNHDGAAVLLTDGQIRAFVTTERLSGLKKHPGLREEDLDELLDQAGARIDDIDHVLLCNLHLMDSPDVVTLHGGDLKDTWLEFWVNQRNDTVLLRGRRIPCTVNPDHHLLHASAAYYTSPFSSGVSVAIDPTGCRAFLGRDNRLFPLRRDFDRWFNANYGYAHVAHHLFGSAIVGAGKVMGLAPYGALPDGADAPLPEVSSFADLVALADADPVTVEADGRALNARLAYYIQRGLEAQVDRLFTELEPLCRRNGYASTICLSGGTALNAPATEKAFTRSGFTGLHLHPACGDDGTALGGALWYWHEVLGHPRREHANAQLMYGRRDYGRTAVEHALRARAGALYVEATGDHAARAAELVERGAVVGWFEGAAEIGPRALGHRSIVADPRDPTMRDRLNTRVKYRERFRPFAPSVLNEHAADWFGLKDSPFMLRAATARRDGIPAAVHIDGTARIQTVERADNPAFHRLVQCFADRTGVPMVVNTSLNTRGRPIVETPEDALGALLDSGLTHLVFPGYVIAKEALK
ncbi:carbamoyltransferase C-terminal domain-containing protein [Kitasatospora sp. NPDC101235]|uniref:carbamoyltransferase C-terminal domain-containing protein n=1 Tax=Kitasatospora sp. NPDC101235 TaxID=3364101 RepID=UPI003822013B